jgi:AcrR family transcriptional regulator
MTAPPPRDAYHHGALREALVAAALAAIEAHGVQAVQVRVIAKELGVAHPAVYRHFENRDALVTAALARAYAELKVELDDAAKEAPASSKDILRALARRYAAFALKRPQVFLAMTGPRVAADGETTLNAAIEEALAPTVAAVQAGQAEGAIDAGHPRAVAIYFWSALQGVLTQIVHRRIGVREDRLDAYIDDVTSRVLRGIER